MKLRRAIVMAWVAFAVALGVGCGALLDLPSDPSFVDCLGDCGEAGADGEDDGTVLLDGGITLGGGDGGDIGDACGLTRPDDDAGIFVLQGGLDAGSVVVCDSGPAPLVPDATDDAANAWGPDASEADATVCVTLPTPERGTRQNPCATIQEGLDLAHATNKSLVYVAGGSYTEAVHLYAGLAVYGAWTVKGDVWTRACDQAVGQVVIQAPEDASTTVTADTLGGEATIAALTVKSKATNIQPGESLYGVFARGTTTKLTMSYVFVEVASGGGGALGTPGVAGKTPNGCTVAGSGASATTVGAAGVPAAPGTFTANGWTPGKGLDGKPGTSGQNGSLGGPGACVTCVTCAKQASICIQSGTSKECGSQGLAGCGGAAGGGGGGGGGGGASIGLYSWGANVTLLGGSLQAGAGGTGAAGGQGGNPGAPGNGVQGPSSSGCGTLCPAGGNCAPTGIESAQGGSPGTPGGAGTGGGAGGGGAGGAACARYEGAAGTANANNTHFSVGPAGKGVTGAPDGPSSFECQ